jgi:DNA-binding NtrC family response regulator
LDPASLEARGFAVHRSDSALHALSVATARFDLVLVDGAKIGLPSSEIVRDVRRRLADVPIVAVVDDAARPAIEAMKAGATDCLVAPVSEARVLRAITRNADGARRARSPRPAPEASFALDGRSPPIQAARRALVAAAKADFDAVLLTGPEGAGKTRAARFLRAHRPDAPFQKARCAQVDLARLERELFGAADAPLEAGLWDRARGGYLCLEELLELPLPVQAALEARLEAQEVDALPAGRRVRLIATSRARPDSSSGVHPKLMHRLMGAHVHLPGLAERPSDIRAIALRILGDLADQLERPRFEIPESSWTRIEQHAWTGNVRELSARLQKAAVTSPDPLLRPDLFSDLDLPPPTRSPLRLPPEGVDLEQLEISFLRQALELAEGNRTRAGQLLGLNRDQVRYRIEKFELDV